MLLIDRVKFNAMRKIAAQVLQLCIHAIADIDNVFRGDPGDT